MQPVCCCSRLPPFTTNSMERSRRRALRSTAYSLRDAAREYAEDFAIERVAEHLVFVTRVDVRVDVDLDEIDAVLHLLQIGAVEAASDQVRGAQSRGDHLLGCLADGQRFRLALNQLLLPL